MTRLENLRAAMRFRYSSKKQQPADDAQACHVGVKLPGDPIQAVLMFLEAKKLSDRLFKGRYVSSVSRTNDGITLLFIDGTRGDIEACDAGEILKYID